jgi:hypothetical protein
MKPNEYDVVRLLMPMPEHHLLAGATGTVVFDHTKFGDSVRPPAYEVELTDRAGKTVAVVTVPEEALEVTWRAHTR